MNARIYPPAPVAATDPADPASPRATSVCCGGSPKAEASACCVLDEQTKNKGQGGCGCSASAAPHPAQASSSACCG